MRLILILLIVSLAGAVTLATLCLGLALLAVIYGLGEAAASF